MSGLDWGVVLLLNGSIVAYGFYLSRGVVASTDWFLAGRRCHGQGLNVRPLPLKSNTPTAENAVVGGLWW